MVVAVATDNMIIASERISDIKQFKSKICSHWDISDLGEICWYLGFEIKQDRTAQTISINQHAYIEDVLERFNLTNTKPVLIPMEPNLQLLSQEGALTPKEAEWIHAVPYAEAIGSILWPAIISRPDISYAVGALAHSIQNPTHRHWEALK